MMSSLGSLIYEKDEAVQLSKGEIKKQQVRSKANIREGLLARSIQMNRTEKGKNLKEKNSLPSTSLATSKEGSQLHTRIHPLLQGLVHQFESAWKVSRIPSPGQTSRGGTMLSGILGLHLGTYPGCFSNSASNQQCVRSCLNWQSALQLQLRMTSQLRPAEFDIEIEPHCSDDEVPETVSSTRPVNQLKRVHKRRHMKPILRPHEKVRKLKLV